MSDEKTPRTMIVSNGDTKKWGVAVYVPSDGLYREVAVCIDGERVRTYIDGVLQEASAPTDGD